MGVSVADTAPTDDTDEIETSTDPAADVEIDGALQDADGDVEVIVRFESVDRATVRASDNAVETLKTKARTAQGPLKRYAARTDGVTVERGFWLANAALVTVDTEKVSLEELGRVDGVERIHENFEMEVQGSEPQPLSPDAAVGDDVSADSTDYTYGLDQINAPDVWNEFGTRGSGAKVAVLDTGVDIDHPDIELYTENPNDPTYPGGWAEFNSDGTRESSEPYDSSIHGTHVTGTVGGTSEHGKWIGVAPEADLMHGLVLSEGTGEFSQVTSGMEWAVEENADVISMSLGGGCGDYSSGYSEQILQAQNAGSIIVASSGNDGEGCSGSPGNLFDSLSVGATYENESIIGFSSGELVESGDFWDPEPHWPNEWIVPDVSAPGHRVISSLPTNYKDYDWGYMSGTSMAAPHVAGTVALMEAATDTDLQHNDIKNALEDTARKPDGWNEENDARWNINEQDSRYGHGIIDAHAAVTAVTTGTFNGTVTDTVTGEPISGATITAVNGSDSFDTTTASDGAFELTVDDDRTYDVTIEVAGYDDVVETDQYVDLNSDVALGTVALSGTASLSGTITDDVTETALENATVTATYAENGGQTYTTETNATGAYAFDRIRGGVEYSVAVSTSGYEETTDTAQVGDSLSETENVSLTGDSTLAGTVTDDASDASLADATINATSAAGSYETTTASDGTYSLTLPGNETAYDVQIAADGYERWTGRRTMNGSTTPLDASLHGDANISITVTEANFGAPVSGATVTVSNETYGTYPVVDEGGGTYNVTNVSSGGTYAISVEASGYVTNTTDVTDVPAGETATHAIAITGNATIEGALTDAYGETASGAVLPIENATITVTRSSDDGSHTLDNATDANGTYAATVPGIGANYTVNASALGYQNASLTTAALGNDATTTADLRIVGNATLSTQVNMTGERTGNPTIAATTNATGLTGVTWNNESAGTNLSVAVPGTGGDYTVNASSRAFSTNSTAASNVTKGAKLGTLSISQLPYFFGIDDATAPESVESGDTVTVSATIVNLGTEDWNDNATLFVDDAETAGRSIALNGTVNATAIANATISFAHEPETTGPASYTLETSNETVTTTVTVEESSGGGGGFGLPAPSDPEPSFWIVDTALGTEKLEAGETGTVTVTVLNSGDGDGEKELQLTADGTVVETASVSVPAGERVEATLEFAFDEPGTYDLTVDGEAVGSVTVTESLPDSTGTDGNESDGTDESDSPGGGDSIPGFTPITALLVLVITAALARRR